MIRENINQKVVHVNFLCMVLVVFVHTYNIVVYNVKDTSVAQSILILCERFISEVLGNQIAVPVFMLLAGYHFFLNLHRNDEITPKIKKRIKTLGIPYLFWNTIGCLFFLIVIRLPWISKIINTKPDAVNIQNILWGILGYKYYYPFWFLARLLCFVFFSHVIFCIMRRKKVVILVLSILVLSSFVSGKCDEYTLKPLFFYLVGGFIAQYKSEWFNETNRIHVILYCLALCGSFIIQLFFKVTLINVVIQFIMPIIFWKAIDIVDLKNVSIYKYENISFFIYCAHTIILEIIEKFFGYILGINIIGAWCDYFLSPVLTIIVIIFIYIFLKKFFPAFTNIICGGRIA